MQNNIIAMPCPPLLLLALFQMAAFPALLSAQTDHCIVHRAPSPPSSCIHEEEEGPHGHAHREEKEQCAAETAMWRSHAEKLESESRLLETQRMLLREEQQLVEAERSALESATSRAEWAHRRTETLVDLLTGESNEYHTVVLTSVTGQFPRESVRNVSELLSTQSSLEFVNPLKIRRQDRTHRTLEPEFTRRSGVLQLQLHREPLNLYGRFVRITVSDHEGRVIHEAHHENRHYAEMLAPLLGTGPRCLNAAPWSE